MALALFSCVINHSPKVCEVITYSAAHFLFTGVSFRSCKCVERRPENVDLNSPKSYLLDKNRLKLQSYYSILFISNLK